MAETRNVESIYIGKRHRKDMGDLTLLAASIERCGLLHPVVVTSDGRLIAGARRLAAYRLLDRWEIPVTTVDIEAIVEGEHDENVARKDFTWTEAVAIREALAPKIKAEAKARQRLSPGRGKRSGNLPDLNKGDARDKAAAFTGKKARTLDKAAAIVASGQTDLVDRLDDENANVDSLHRELKQRQAREAYDSQAVQGCTVADLDELAASGRKFAVIYADPPWSFEVYSGKGKQRSAERHYDTMTLEAIMALPVASLAADNCALFLWGVHPELLGAIDVMQAWGFTYKTLGFDWVKLNRSSEGLHTGMGYWTRANTEPCWLATRGAPQRLANDVHQVVMAPVGEHSEKPDEVRNRIERLVAGPYLELFGRKPVKGWTVWGNQIPQAEFAGAA